MSGWCASPSSRVTGGIHISNHQQVGAEEWQGAKSTEWEWNVKGRERNLFLLNKGQRVLVNRQQCSGKQRHMKGMLFRFLLQGDLLLIWLWTWQMLISVSHVHEQSVLNYTAFHNLISLKQHYENETGARRLILTIRRHWCSPSFYT